MKKVLIVGGGFAGINVAKMLGKLSNVEITLVDRRNHHLFQPLLYQVALAGLSPSDIAAPIRSMLSRFRNTRVLQGELTMGLVIFLVSTRSSTDSFQRMAYAFKIVRQGFLTPEHNSSIRDIRDQTHFPASHPVLNAD